MPKNKTVPLKPLTKADERKILAAQSAKIRKNPALGVEIAKQAGILTKSGQLATYYKQKA